MLIFRLSFAAFEPDSHSFNSAALPGARASGRRIALSIPESFQKIERLQVYNKVSGLAWETGGYDRPSHCTTL